MTESIKIICRVIRREGFAQILVDGDPWEIDVDPMDRSATLTTPAGDQELDSIADLIEMLEDCETVSLCS